jgi:alpha-glucan phosphorylase-like protein
VLLEESGATIADLKKIATTSSGDYSDTKLMISLSRLASGVSEIHVAAELHDHPQSKLITITNGVFDPRWRAENWGANPLLLNDRDFWNRHSENRHKLFALIRAQTGDSLDPELLTVVWARRMASYKRPELLVNDLKRLAKVMYSSTSPVQFVVAGRANPADTIGVELMKQVMAASKNPRLTERFAYLPYYNPVSARLLAGGADLWLNTPIRGYEACGTSGMKASLNGALQFSTSDGWIDEVDLEPIGWTLPDNDPAPAIYQTLEHDIAPVFYDRWDDGLPHAWIKMMRANMELVSHQFTATRMLEDYYAKLYAPAAH